MSYFINVQWIRRITQFLYHESVEFVKYTEFEYQLGLVSIGSNTIQLTNPIMYTLIKTNRLRRSSLNNSTKSGKPI